MEATWHVDRVVADAERALSGTLATRRREAQLLVATALRRPRAWVLAHPEAALDASQHGALWGRVRRLAAGEPLAYVLGEWEFFARPFEVTRDVLIPRPESELLVEAGLEFLRRRPDSVAADVGTGSGCLAVSLAAECEGVRVAASDISRAALLVADRNARRHTVRGRVSLVQADLLPPGRIRFDLVCANLPYIPRPRLSNLEVARREPRLALDGGSDGLKVLGRLIRQLVWRLADGGRALLELDEGQAERLRPLLARHLPGWHASLRRDLAGRERLLVLDQP